MERDVKVVHVSRYSFVDEKNGQVLEGTKITFMDSEENKTDDSFGRKIYTGILDYKEFDKLKDKKLPLDCKAIYEQVALDKKPKFKGLVY